MKKIKWFSLTFAFVLAIALIFPTTVSADAPNDGRTVFGDSFTLNSGEILDGDLSVFGGVVEIQTDAIVKGDVFVLGGVVTIDGTVEGDMTVIGGTVTLEANTLIEGNLTSPASYINRVPGAEVKGNSVEGFEIPGINIAIPDIPEAPIVQQPVVQLVPTITSVARTIGTLLVMVSLGTLMLLIMPKSVETMTSALVVRPWHILGFGALTALVMIVGGVILALTICLIPVVALVGLAVGLATLAGWLALGYELGKRIASGIFRTEWNPVLSAALGNLVLYLLARGLTEIPCLGSFLVLVAALFGLGMAVVTLFGTRPYPQLGAADQNGQEVLTVETETAADELDEPSTN
ncbi:polymer-forming cytoskeletal protein [bacterium]|nr:polymer-forming cytoskeletal protein [bacterium]